MSPHLLLSFYTLFAAPPALPAAPPATPADSVVKVTASVRYPEPTRPWARPKAVAVAGSGVVIAGGLGLRLGFLLSGAFFVGALLRFGGSPLALGGALFGFDHILA